MVVLALFLIHGYTHIKIIPSFSWHPELGRVLGMAGNLFIRSLALNIALLFAVRQAAGLGASAIGAHTIAINLWLFAAFFIDGYAVAGKILAGRFIGAHDIPSLWQLSQKILFYGLGVTALLIVFGVIFYTQIGLQFSSDKAVLSDFGTLFKWVLIGLPICSVAFIFDGIFKGLGKTQLLRNLLVLTTTLGYLPSLFLGQYMEWGLIGIWGALTFWMALRGGVLVWKFHQYFHPLLQKT
jgi:Na+-driven multidrug efflux pump